MPAEICRGGEGGTTWRSRIVSPGLSMKVGGVRDFTRQVLSGLLAAATGHLAANAKKAPGT